MEPSRPASEEPLLEVRKVNKAFAGVRALVDVSLSLRAGEVHALMGENGAGKSTLMKVLAGLHQPDSGEIQLRGRPVVIKNPHEAIRNGIAMIHQELMPIPHMTVAENILLGHEPAAGFLGWVDRRAMRREAKELLSPLAAELPVDRKMLDLSVAEMQTVEIAKALSRKADIIIMDEPSSAISDREVESLFGVIRMLKQRGVAIIYITHKMDEVFRIADTITVLRDGSFVGAHPARELDERKLIALMVGRELRAVSAKQSKPGGEVALSVRGLNKAGKFRDISFEVRRGEILGIAGLMGAGRTEVVSAIFGLAPADSGEISVAGRSVRIKRPADAIRHGIGMVTEDRKGYGLVQTMSVKHNMTLASLSKCCNGSFIRRSLETAIAERNVRVFSIKTSNHNQPIGHLSGGNQQKVVIARSLLADPTIVILDEPTRGIDIGAKAEVYEIITQLAREGKSVIMVSSEMPEVLSLSDRLLVMRQGMITAEMDPARATQEEVLKHAMPI